MSTSADTVDQIIAAWRLAHPELDPSALGVVGRMILLGRRLEESVSDVLKEHKLTLGQFDILATLRRQSTTGGMTPTQLLKSVVLSSGGMTNRLDTLEKKQWIRRLPDPNDRRGVIVQLTNKGRKLIDEATKTRIQEAKNSLSLIDELAASELEATLRQWMLALDSQLVESH